MRTSPRLKTVALLMCSTTLNVVLCIMATSVPIQASNCCQSCEIIDTTCYAGCEDADRCGSDPECLSVCYASCDDWSADCWGIQGQGRYCTWCQYFGGPYNYVCQYEPYGDDWWHLTGVGCWPVG